jgi:hypothetical protein
MKNKNSKPNYTLLKTAVALAVVFILSASANKLFSGITSGLVEKALLVTGDVPYTLQVANAKQISPKEYEFEVFLLNNSEEPIELQIIQFGIGFDNAILNGGTAKAEVIEGSSELNSVQSPKKAGIGKDLHKINETEYCFFNVMARTPPGAGSGTVIAPLKAVKCDHPGVRVGKFKITNSVKFLPNSSPKHVFSTGPGQGRTNTLVQIYKKSAAVNITKAENNWNHSTPSACSKDIVLNGKK